MGRNGFLSVIFLFLILADSSSTTLSIRKLSSGAPSDTKNSPLPSPVPIANEPKPSQTEFMNSKPSGSYESCEGSTRTCKEKGLFACIQGPESGTGDLVVLVWNEGESDLKVNISDLENKTKEYLINKNQSKKINIRHAIVQSTNIVLQSDIPKCVILIPVGPALSEGNFFQRLPSYYKQVTPIYVAYFLFLIVGVVGGTLVCCKFRNRRRQDEVPYQELEMGSPESASLVNTDSVNGWDEGWDDDWDEDKAVKSPGGSHVGSISANGLTARTTNREGLEKDWSD